MTSYTNHEWLAVAQRLQSIAQAGLTYSDNKYDLERYEQLMQLAKDIICDYSSMQHETLDKIFDMEQGYLTPKVDVRGVILEDEKILLVKESIDGKWSLPGGWADVGLSASEVVVKEVEEETGLRVKASELIAVFDKKHHAHPPDLYYVYKMFFRCIPTGGRLQKGMETDDAAFFAFDDLPELSLGRVTPEQLRIVFENKNKSFNTLFD